MIIARPLLDQLGEEAIEALLDLIEDPFAAVSIAKHDALRRFVDALEKELGEHHVAALQVRRATIRLAN